MDHKNINKFRELLIKHKKNVSELEYTRNNYDNHKNLIKEDLPTIITDFCEIGLYNYKIYFVFITESKTINIKLFDELKNKSNVRIYGFIDFNKTLFPIKNFIMDNFIQEIQKDKYLQIQFDFKDINTQDLFIEYSNLVKVFKKNKVKVVNQLKVDLTKKDL